MNKRFLTKLLTIAGLILIMMIPLSMIQVVVSDRTMFREQAKLSIANSWTGRQSFLGPFLVQPYTEYTQVKTWDENLKAYQIETISSEKQLLILPDELNIKGDITTEERRRGLYAIPVYNAALAVQGSFSNQPILNFLKSSANKVELHKPYVSLIISDIRGIVTQPVLAWGNQTSEFISGAGLADSSSGMRADVSVISVTTPATYSFSFDTHLHGMETLQFSPAGKSTVVDVKSAWLHPSFDGRYLPSERNIDDNGFTATWRASSFSSNMEHVMNQCQFGDCNDLMANTFGVSLIQPVDIYQQTERSVKYASLFIVLTFVVFFLFEIMKSMRLHPMHYVLVGASLTLFYLLLISISEHIDFFWAYVISSLANIAVISIYISEVLQSRLRAAAFTGLLLLLYFMLYVILRSEDNALLMGSLLIFGILSAVMVITRKLDWYKVAEQISRQTPAVNNATQAGNRADSNTQQV